MILKLKNNNNYFMLGHKKLFGFFCCICVLNNLQTTLNTGSLKPNSYKTKIETKNSYIYTNVNISKN